MTHRCILRPIVSLDFSHPSPSLGLPPRSRLTPSPPDDAPRWPSLSAPAALDAYQAAIQISIDMGRFAMAAKQLMTVAEINEGQLADLDAALAAYQQVRGVVAQARMRTHSTHTHMHTCTHTSICRPAGPLTYPSGWLVAVRCG